MFNPCILIPIYNHKETIRQSVAALVRYQIPIIIVDDGSDEATQEVLAKIAQDFEWTPKVTIDTLSLIPNPSPGGRREQEPLSLRERTDLQSLSLRERTDLQPLSLRERGRGEGQRWERAKQLVYVFRITPNQGKGAAVMEGMRQAWALGLSHALQIDADGQHNIDDVEKFLFLSSKNPEAIICGQPIFDASIPKERLYGRYLTHVMVWIETLSFAVKDALCGFRLYPLATTYPLINAVNIGKRMEFDTDIIVRLSWRGVPILNISTPVIYPEGGTSHFNLWRDNLRLIKMHIRLVTGMLFRFPVLLFSKFFLTTRQKKLHWAKISEHGNKLGILFVFHFYRLFGRRVTQLFLYPIVAYFFIVGHRSRRASLDYLQRLFLYAANNHHPVLRPTWRDAFKHMLAFAESALDKVIAWCGKLPEHTVNFTNSNDFKQLMQSDRGALIIGSHLGNLEMCRALAMMAGYKTINAVVYSQHTKRFNHFLSTLHEEQRFNLIEVTEIGPDTAIAFQEKIEKGELLFIVGDRTPPSDNDRDNNRIVRVPFLGQDAPFAQGPFILAHMLSCPVYLFFCLWEDKQYQIYFEHFADCVSLPRQDREQNLRDYLQRYAGRLEHYCLKAPYQWFNFFDFWQFSAMQKTGGEKKYAR